jgi:D-beta-D-heptose 7-phosphate kinase/D-beta-D-heptose 1-phosphate adenosyltransferase
MTSQQQIQFNILLIGDNGKDIYQYGTTDRLSPEAPIPIFVPKYKEERDGMAGNVCNNLLALGCKVNYLFDKTSVKTRLIEERSKQQIVRVDNDITSTPIVISDKLTNLYDAIVISDYNKGTVTYELIEQLRKEFTGLIVIDTKKTDLQRFEGCFVKINSLEYSCATSYCNNLIVTQGAAGVKYQDNVIAPPIVEVSDITGAGDTFLAAFTVAFLKTNNVFTAIDFANKASSLTVQHLGVYAPTIGEIDAT